MSTIDAEKKPLRCPKAGKVFLEESLREANRESVLAHHRCSDVISVSGRVKVWMDAAFIHCLCASV